MLGLSTLAERVLYADAEGTVQVVKMEAKGRWIRRRRKAAGRAVLVLQE